MTRLRLLALPVALFACAGCATVSARYAAMEAGPPPEEKQVFGDVERLEFAKRVQVTLPAKLAVTDVGWKTQRHGEDVTDKRLVQLVDALAEDQGTWSDVSSLSWQFAGEDLPPRARLEDLRVAASRHQADLLLVSARRERVREGHNVAAVFKVLLLPLLFLPTEEDELRLDVRAAVIDVRNGLVYATFEDHREADVTASVAGEREAVERAFDAAWAASLEKMASRLAGKLRTLERGD